MQYFYVHHTLYTILSERCLPNCIYITRTYRLKPLIQQSSSQFLDFTPAYTAMTQKRKRAYDQFMDDVIMLCFIAIIDFQERVAIAESTSTVSPSSSWMEALNASDDDGDADDEDEKSCTENCNTDCNNDFWQSIFLMKGLTRCMLFLTCDRTCSGVLTCNGQ